MATAAWYHRDISRVEAEDLLARAGRDGSFLVRDSESVPGAYALCLLFQRHVHTYRIVPDVEGLLAVQTSQGVQTSCFHTLGDLVSGYQQPHKGLVAPLLYPIGREAELGDESSDGDDEKPLTAWNHNSACGTSGQAPNITSGPHLLFLKRLQELNIPCIAGGMAALLSEYLCSDLPVDLEGIRRGGSGLSNLQRLMATACEGLRSEIDLTFSSLETLAKVFDHPNCPLTGPKMQNARKASDSSVDNLVCKISALCSLLSSLEKRVLKALQDALANHNLTVQPAPQPEPPTTSKSPATPVITHTFQVKVVRYGRQTVSVDVDNGVLLFERKSGAFGVDTISHDRILKLVRFHSSPLKLCMLVDSHTGPPLEMLFESLKKREAFCQLLLLMRSRVSQHCEPDIISIFVGTWNMGSSPPPRNLHSWVKCCGLGHVPDESTAALPHDIYAFGTQENTQGEREWAEHMKATLRAVTQIDYKQVVLQSLWNIRLVVFVRPEHEKRISHVTCASVKTGLGNTLGHKGAVGASFLFNSTSLGFVNAHLTSSSEKTARRNQNFQDILRLLSLGDRQLGSFDISLRFTHLFWCGDLNYRLELDVEDILKHISKREFDALMCADQLTRERHKRKAFLHFNEEKISFPPTYRYERGSRDCYLWQKYKTSGVRINVPSWCDRILWKSYPETHISCTAYGCTDDVTTSDHSPVFATFQVGVASTPAAKTDLGSAGEKAWIELENVEVIVKTASKAKFFIEFHSSCLGEFRRSGENDAHSCEVLGFLKLGWSLKQLPKLVPIASEVGYIRDQHLLLSVKSCDSFESYGECCVALRSLIGTTTEHFETFLTHRGEEMGSIRGRARVLIPRDRRQARERLYDWFCFEKDETGLAKGHTTPPLSHAASSRFAAPTPLTSQHTSTATTSAPSSYTNPAYFIFEGVPIQRKTEESISLGQESRMIWSKDSVVQLPRVSGSQRQDWNHPRRSDFIEIEIPGCLPQPGSSYQLFPAQDKALVAPPVTRSSMNMGSATGKDLPSVENRFACKDKGNFYTDNSHVKEPLKLHKDLTRGDRSRLQQERLSSVNKSHVLYPYMSTRLPRRESAVPWVVEPQSGDNSLTALQIAKSLSDMDFLPFNRRHLNLKSSAKQRNLGYELALATERGYSWDKESVLHGAPETVQELLSNLGLQRYTLGLSLNGWDDLDYFSGITERDLQAAGVTNPVHRRKILENLPKIWD